jgi:hypothetical protein
VTTYLLSIYQPEGVLPPADLAPIQAALEDHNADLKARGAWVFAGGLAAQSSATVVRSRDGEALLTDGPFAEAKEHIGGISIIRADDLDAALEVAARLAGIVAPLAVEVRPFLGQ